MDRIHSGRISPPSPRPPSASQSYSIIETAKANGLNPFQYLKYLFSVKQISPFSSSEFPIVIVGKSPLSAGLVRKQVPLLHPAA